MPYQKITLTDFGGPEKLELKQEDHLPQPGPQQVRVKVLAAGTGFTDTIVRQGQYVDVKEKPPFTPGYDWYGVIDALGSEVNDWQVGQAVADLSIIGGYTQYLCTDVSRLIPAPEGLDPAEAVSMVLSYGTAYQLLHRLRGLAPGDKVLVHGGGGAVGTALLELAALLQLEVYSTTSASKRALVQSLGAQHIDYQHEDFVERTLALSGGGVDLVLDTIGGRNWSRSYRCLKRGGLLVGFGALQLTSGEESTPQLLWGLAKLLGFWKLIPDGKRTCFYNIEHRRRKHPEEFLQDMGALFTLLKDEKISPRIAGRLPLSEAAEAHRRIDQGEVLGKLVLLCHSDTEGNPEQ